MTAPHEFMIPYDLFAREGESADAVGYSVGSTWTRIYSLPGRTGFTAHFIQLGDILKRLPIASAAMRLVYQSSDNTQPSARIIALSYGSGGAVWESDWGTFTRDSNNPTNQKTDVTTKLLALLSSGRTSPQVSVEVYGTGIIQQATLEVVYAVPDYSEVIAALEARIEALETAGPPAPFPVVIQGGLTITLAEPTP